jgi:hypothetical protein
MIALRSKLTYSNVIASLALFAALSGVAVATGLPKNSVGTKQLKKNAVTAAKLKKGAVTSQKIAPNAVISGKLSANAVGTGNLGNGVVTSAKLAKNSVTSPAIANGVVGTSKLGNEAVTTAKLGKGSVTAAKLDSEIGPLLGTLKSGQTLRGVFDVGSTAEEAPAELARAGISYQFPLLNAPTVTVLGKGETSGNCAGLSGGNAQTPQATAGNLCVYITEAGNLDAAPLAVENNTRLGFGLVAKAKEKGNYFAYGQWAVTAP